MLYAEQNGVQREIEDIILDINHGLKHHSSEIKVKSGDRKSRVLAVQITDNGTPFNLTYMTARLYMLKPDGTKVFADADITIPEFGNIIVTLTEQMLAAPGVARCEFVLTGADDSLLSTAIFKITIQESINDRNAIQSTNEFSSLLNAIDKVDGLDNRIAILNENVAKNNAQLSGKIHKGEPGVISNAMLSQEVKEAMTGGSVAVVGKNAVLTENIADGQVTGEKTDFLEVKRLNLFDGKFLNGYISGTVGNAIYTTNSVGKTIALNIDPSTTYSVIKSQVDAESGYFYLKIVTSTKTVNEVLETMSGGTTAVLDGGFQSLGTSTNSPLLTKTFTTGANDKSLFITVSRELVPYVEVLKGSYSNFQCMTYEPIYIPKSNVDVYRKQEVLDLLQNSTTTSKSNTFVKTSSRCEILLQNKVGYTLEHKMSGDINLDTWMLTKGTVNGVTLWSGSDIEAPIKEVGTNDFIGGYHGDERFESAQIICDGVLLNLDRDYNLTFNNLTVFVKSTLFRCDTNVPVFTRYKKLQFTDNELIISNRLICLVDNFLVNRYTGCGLYSVYKDLLFGYTVNTTPELITSGGVNADIKLDSATLYGNGFTATIKALSGKTDEYKGYVVDFANESRPRYKVYFDCIISNGVRLNTNDELNASFSINIV